MVEDQSIFISHASEDHQLAHAWQVLIRIISSGAITPWYSGDKRAGGGIGIEEWRMKISNVLSEAKHILVLLTPGSNERPWVLFESGIAFGQKKDIIPVVHFMEKTEVHDIFKGLEVYDGRNEKDVFKLLQLMVFDGREVPDESKAAWQVPFDNFREALSQERLATFTRNLFQDHFHNKQEAKKIEGVWAAKWIEIGADGKEIPFEEDALYVWSTGTRVRMVGVNTKKGIEEILPGESGFYPMEGVVSGDRNIALSYWSAGDIPICGACLLRRKGSSGNKYEGYWQGITTRNIDEDPVFTQGRVLLIRIGRKIIPPQEVQKELEKIKKGA